MPDRRSSSAVRTGADRQGISWRQPDGAQVVGRRAARRHRCCGWQSIDDECADWRHHLDQSQTPRDRWIHPGRAGARRARHPCARFSDLCTRHDANRTASPRARRDRLPGLLRRRCREPGQHRCGRCCGSGDYSAGYRARVAAPAECLSRRQYRLSCRPQARGQVQQRGGTNHIALGASRSRACSARAPTSRATTGTPATNRRSRTTPTSSPTSTSTTAPAGSAASGARATRRRCRVRAVGRHRSRRSAAAHGQPATRGRHLSCRVRRSRAPRLPVHSGTARGPNSRSHHSNMDTFDRVQKAEAKQQDFVIAVLAWSAANSPEQLPRQTKRSTP